MWVFCRHIKEKPPNSVFGGLGNQKNILSNPNIFNIMGTINDLLRVVEETIQ